MEGSSPGYVVCNASNNELVRTQTLVKSAIVQVDAAPFKQWYLTHYGVDICRKKKAPAAKKESAEVLFLATQRLTISYNTASHYLYSLCYNHCESRHFRYVGSCHKFILLGFR